MSLTGKFDLRRSFGGKLVLRVEEERRPWWSFGRGQTRCRWRDATQMDLTSPELRTLLDLRFKPLILRPTYFTRSEPPPEQRQSSEFEAVKPSIAA